VVDPTKFDFYAMDCYRQLAEDKMAGHLAEEVLRASTDFDGAERAPMRNTEARVNLGVIAARPLQGESPGHHGRCLRLCHDAGVPTHVALLRGVNNLGGKKVAMTELRELVTSLGHADVMTYIQSGNVLFTPSSTGGSTGEDADAAALAAELEQAIAAGIGVRARAVVLSREELARCVRDNPYPGQTDPKRLHAVFLPEAPGSSLAAWIAGAERQVRAKGSRDEALVRGRTVYLHTPDGYPRSELRRVLAKAGGPTSARVAGTARNWATVSRLLELCGP
jgi:uncharacterized protein (DUF1697 family)